MSVRTAFCTVCNREVHLSDDSPSTCPVCSSPLIESGDESLSPSAQPRAASIGPELYLG